jgi:penicillin amidase
MNVSRLFALFFWSVLGALLVYALNNSWSTANAPIPALGQILNPYSGLWANAEGAFENHDFTGAPVQEEVHIVYDDDLVPHIYADNLQDALFAQGYVEAQNRLFQMDVSTRDPDGRLSEILGEGLLKRDLSQRRLGLGYAADNAVKAWKKFPEELKLLEAYTAGINYYMDRLSPKDWPMEYKLLGVEPESWSIRKSALLLKAMSQTLCGYEEDVENSNALALFKDDFPLIYPERNSKDIPVIPKSYILPSEVDESNPVAYGPMSDIFRKRSPDGVGSNNWALMPEKSATGNAVLCNDPHLGLSLPSVWFEVHIITPDFSARGVSLLGMPGIMIGFNQNIAWGETNVGHDVMDYHKIRWANEDKTSYYYDDQVLDVEYRIERIPVRGKEDVLDTVKYTVWGPLANEKEDLALRWIVHDQVDKPDFLTFIQGMTCSNYQDYLEATAVFYAPAQNFIYADNEGNIGLRINGKLPIKSKEMGRFVRPGDLSEQAWKGFIPRTENPQAYNPEQGFLASANQWSTDSTYPYYYNGNFEGFRGRRINALLRQDKKFDLEDLQSFQNDVYHVMAADALPVLLKHTEGLKNDMLAQLRGWDYRMSSESRAALYFDVWFTEIHKLLWDEVYLNKDVELPEPDLWHTANILSSEADHPYIDLKGSSKKETLKDLVLESMNKTLDSLDGRQDLQYGNSRNVQIRHLLRIPAFSVDSLPLGGHKHTLNAQQSTFGPSWRMMVELSDQPNAFGTYPGGQSGNPASAYYSNRIETWASGSYDTLSLPSSGQEIDRVLYQIKFAPE